jgi:chromosome segregation ATPase
MGEATEYAKSMFQFGERIKELELKNNQLVQQYDETNREREEWHQAATSLLKDKEKLMADYAHANLAAREARDKVKKLEARVDELEATKSSQPAGPQLEHSRDYVERLKHQTMRLRDERDAAIREMQQANQLASAALADQNATIDVVLAKVAKIRRQRRELRRLNRKILEAYGLAQRRLEFATELAIELGVVRTKLEEGGE